MLPLPSSEKRFFAYMMRKRFVGPQQLARGGRAFIAALFAGDPHGMARNKDYLADLDVETICREAERFASDRLIPLLRPDMVDRLHSHRAAGDHVVLLTGAPDFLADTLGRHLDVDEVCATQCRTANGRYLVAPPLRHPYREQKLLIAEQLAAQQKTTLAETTAYGDSRHDIALLSAVGHPVAVEPDRKLRQRANVDGWEIVTSTA